MTEEQMRALMEWVEAQIDLSIEKAFGRNCQIENDEAFDRVRQLEESMGFEKSELS